jgi:hypothetical protein
MSFLKCSPKCSFKKKQFPCGNTDYCPTCHWARIGDAIFREYKVAYTKAGPWYAITLSFVWHDGKLKLETRKRAKGRGKPKRHAPFAGAPRLRPLAFSESQQIRACGQTPFRLLSILREMGILRGALAALDCHVAFFPVKAPRHYLSVGEGLLIHAHVLANTAKPLDWDTCQEIYQALLDHRQNVGIRLQPDLHIAPLQSNQEFLAWLKYVVKPLVFEKFYAEGVAVCGDRPEHFNLHYDQVVFNGLSDAYASVKSPRRYGNMQFRPDNKGYIGEYQYKKRIGARKFGRLQLREHEPDLEPLTAKEKEQLAYERKRLAQHGTQVDEWRQEKKNKRRPGRPQGHGTDKAGLNVQEPGEVPRRRGGRRPNQH